jgi:hypothetical protein
MKNRIHQFLGVVGVLAFVFALHCISPSISVAQAGSENKDAKEVKKAEKDAGESKTAAEHKPAGLEAEILKELASGRTFKDVMHSMMKTGVSAQNFVAAAIKAGVDSSSVVYSSIKEGEPAQVVVKTALKAGAHLDDVVKAALRAGADKKAVYAGAAEAGAAPAAVAKALNMESDRHKNGESATERKTKESHAHFASQTPALFGIGGVILQELPEQTRGKLRLGTASINPFVSLRETFSDNIFFANTGKKSDMITTVIPGARGYLPFGTSHKAELEAYAVINQYSKNTDEHTKLYHADGSVTFNEGKSAEFRLSEYHARDLEPRSSTANGSIEIFQTNTAAAEGMFRVNEALRFQVSYAMSGWTFQNDYFRNHDENLATGAVYYRILHKTSAFVELDHKSVTYTQSAWNLDSTENAAYAGLAWDASPHAHGTVKAGLLTKDFKSSAYKDGTVKVGAADMKYDFGGHTELTMLAQRSVNETNVLGMPYSITTAGFGEVKHMFVPKFSGVARASFVEDSGEGQVERTTLVGAGLKYKVRSWLEFALDYNQTQRGSAAQAREFTEHSSMLMANMSL